MSDHLASIHGTEKDRSNCSFFFKMGACQYGDRCSKYHQKPVTSHTLLLSHFYENPASKIDPHSGEPLISKLSFTDVQNHFEHFYEEVFTEFSVYGEITEMHVCENLSDQLIGNVYIVFRTEKDAIEAHRAMHGQYYAGRTLHAEFSSVANFHASQCQDYLKWSCKRGAFCNFMHIKLPAKRLLYDLYTEMYERFELKHGPNEWKKSVLQQSESHNSSRNSRNSRSSSYSSRNEYRSARRRPSYRKRSQGGRSPSYGRGQVRYQRRSSPPPPRYPPSQRYQR